MQTESANNSVVVVPLTSKFELRFDDDIVQPSYYRFELQSLEMATEQDSVEITVNSDGGSLATGIEMANAIFNCKAETTGILRSSAHSCGSIIFLSCTSHDVGLGSELLIHTGAGGNYGTPSQSIQRAASYKRQVRTLFETIYKGFLTDSELELLIEEDKEYIFGGDEIVERLHNMYEHRNNLVTEQHQEFEDKMVEENNLIVEEVLSTLPFSEEEKEVFNKISAAIDSVFMEEATGGVVDSILSEVTPEVFPRTELVDNERNIYSYSDKDFSIEYELSKEEKITLDYVSWETDTERNGIGLHEAQKEHREQYKTLLDKFDVVFKSKESTTVLHNKLCTYLCNLIEGWL